MIPCVTEVPFDAPFIPQGGRGPPGEGILGPSGVPGIPGEKGDTVCTTHQHAQ